MLLILAAVGCGSEPTRSDDPVVSRLSCAQPSGPVVECDLVLESTTGFRVVLLDRECVAHGNSLRLTKPIKETLTSDGCYTEVGTEWVFPGPYAPGTPISLEVESAASRGTPGLLVEGTYPNWTINFEDGSDTDFNDLHLQVEPLP